MRGVKERIHRALERRWLRTVFSFSEKRAHGPLILYACAPERPDLIPGWFERAEEALGLLERVDPRRFARMCRDVDSILIDAVYGPSFVASIRGIRLRGPVLERIAVERTACTLVHESTHARIEARGIRYREPHRARHERLCVLESARFAMKLPDGEALARSLLLSLRTKWWTDEAMHAERLAELDRMGLPRPLAHAMRWVIKLRGPRRD